MPDTACKILVIVCSDIHSYIPNHISFKAVIMFYLFWKLFPWCWRWSIVGNTCDAFVDVICMPARIQLVQCWWNPLLVNWETLWKMVQVFGPFPVLTPSEILPFFALSLRDLKVLVSEGSWTYKGDIKFHKHLYSYNSLVGVFFS